MPLKFVSIPADPCQKNRWVWNIFGQEARRPVALLVAIAWNCFNRKQELNNKKTRFNFKYISITLSQSFCKNIRRYNCISIRQLKWNCILDYDYTILFYRFIIKCILNQIKVTSYLLEYLYIKLKAPLSDSHLSNGLSFGMFRCLVSSSNSDSAGNPCIFFDPFILKGPACPFKMSSITRLYGVR